MNAAMIFSRSLALGATGAGLLVVEAERDLRAGLRAMTELLKRRRFGAAAS
jgi:hypothetical protein